MRILLLVNWYPPDLRVPARRWGHLIAELQSVGFECTIVSAGDGSEREIVGPTGERVLRIPISNGDEELATGKVELSGRKSSRSYLHRVLNFVIPLALRDFRTFRWIKYVRKHPDVQEIVADSDIIIASYGPLGPLVAGWCLARHAGKPWIADIRDAFESKDLETYEVSRWFSRQLEKIILKTASLRLTVSEKLSGYLCQRYGLSFSAIYNGWTDADIVKRKSSKAPTKYLYYPGSIYPHQLQALSIVLDSLDEFKSVKLRMRLLNDNTGGRLQELLKTHPARANVELLPPVSAQRVREELSEALAALVLEDVSGVDELRLGTVTGKLFGLLASGLPGIAVSSAQGEISDLVDDVPCWYCVGDVVECRDAIRGVMQPQAYTGVGCLTQYHMTNQAHQLAKLLRDTR
ncbi:hypothetical protein [Desulfuromonas acetoxidans]|uniref:hypothetical protein n=1 Tax=Desulfuromonas acetoxidans TaxID=891 RepID=UPI00292DAFCE|nr:hypothetical protein [Desulfuromonas acetoxidans]